MLEENRPRPFLIAVATAIIMLMFYLGAQPFSAGLFRSPWDKLAHFLTYAILTALFRFGIGGGRPLRLVSLIAAIASLDELHQLYVPGRTGDLADLATDIAGAVAAIMACEWYARSRGHSLPPPGAATRAE